MATNANVTRLTNPFADTRVPSALLVTNVTRRPVPGHPPAPKAPALFTMQNEPEDALLTGGTRSLDRRLLALNVSRTHGKLRSA